MLVIKLGLFQQVWREDWGESTVATCWNYHGLLLGTAQVSIPNFLVLSLCLSSYHQERFLYSSPQWGWPCWATHGHHNREDLYAHAGLLLADPGWLAATSTWLTLPFSPYCFLPFVSSPFFILPGYQRSFSPSSSGCCSSLRHSAWSTPSLVPLWVLSSQWLSCSLWPSSLQESSASFKT